MAGSLWYEDQNTVNDFASVLNDAGKFFATLPHQAIANVLAYFEKPYHWVNEWNLWISMDKPRDDSERWDEFVDALD